MVTRLKRRRFTLEQYHQMGEAGILGEDDRVELIDGEVVEMTPIGSRHSGCVIRLNRLLLKLCGDDATISPQNPVDLGQHSEPQPDFAVLHPRADSYSSEHPTAADVLLLVEVADSSADPDRRVKAPLYARSGVPEFWLVNLERETITVYLNPTAKGYRTARVARRGEAIAPAAFPNRPLAVADILG